MTALVVRVLFVCMGNICRSPAAENVMRHLVAKAGLSDRIHCDSAGTIGYHVGEAPDERMSAAGKKRGIIFTGRSRRFTAGDFDNFDIILAMDRENLKGILALARNESDPKKASLFCEYVQSYDDSEVPDPYYGGESGFEHVMDLMEDGCINLLDQLKI